MKLKINFKILLIIAILLALVIAKLISNKKDFNREQNLVSESSNIVPVITEKVGFKSVNSIFSAYGTFSADKEVTVSSEISGKVVSVNVENGNHVSTGQVLAVLDNTVLSAQLEQAKANLQRLKNDLHSDETLLKTDGATGEQVEQSKQAVIDAQTTLVSLQNQYDNSFIKAPFAGIVTRRYIEKGTFLSPGSEVFDLSNITRLRLIVKVTANQIGVIKKGENVSVIADVFPDEPITGAVYTINDKADQSKLYNIEILTDNTLNGKIKPGMSGKVSFNSNDSNKALVIPRVAIPGSLKNPEVYIVRGDSVVLQKITITPLNEKEVIVKEGLATNDIIVVSGQINLENGFKVKQVK